MTNSETLESIALSRRRSGIALMLGIGVIVNYFPIASTSPSRKTPCPFGIAAP